MSLCSTGVAPKRKGVIDQSEIALLQRAVAHKHVVGGSCRVQVEVQVDCTCPALSLIHDPKSALKPLSSVRHQPGILTRNRTRGRCIARETLVPLDPDQSLCAVYGDDVDLLEMHRRRQSWRHPPVR